MLSFSFSKPIADQRTNFKPFPVIHADTQLTTPQFTLWRNACAERGTTWRESRLCTAFESDAA